MLYQKQKTYKMVKFSRLFRNSYNSEKQFVIFGHNMHFKVELEDV